MAKVGNEYFTGGVWEGECTYLAEENPPNVRSINYNFFQRTKNYRKMLKFLESWGGAVRFDKYMQEHLFGKGGFYSDIIDIPWHFTTSAQIPEFAHLLYLYLQRSGLTERDFLEIGGGNGAFKGFYLSHSPITRFISVDASARLAEKQAEVDGKPTIIASADSLPLEDGCVDGVIFSNELLDALPARVLLLEKRGERVRIIKEGYVYLEGRGIKFGFREAERDKFVLKYERFLNEYTNRSMNVHEGDIVCVSPQMPDVLSEFSRVLRSGRIILLDYGSLDICEYQSYRRKRQELPYYSSDSEQMGLEKILERPYHTDITYNVDFDFLLWLAERDKSIQNIRSLPQNLFFRNILLRCRPFPLEDKIVQHSKLLGPTNIQVFEFDK